MPKCKFLFSAVFVFQKSCAENILGIERDKLPAPYNYEGNTVPENDRRGVSQVARPHPGAASPGPAPGWCLGPPRLPRLRLFAYKDPSDLKVTGISASVHEKLRSSTA